MFEILIFIIVLSVLIISHEFGHFIVAKRAGMRVDEFGLGFPPRLFGVKKGETLYSLNAIPFGGFVRIHGEEPPQEGKKEGGPDPDFGRRFTSRSRWAQGAVVLAGVFFNILLAWLLFTLVFLIGAPTSTDVAPAEELRNVEVLVTGVLPGSPAEEAGLKLGDRLVALSADGKEVRVASAEDVSKTVSVVPQGESVLVTVLRGGEETSFRMVPKSGLIQDEESRPAIGISMDAVGIKSYPLHKAFLLGAERTWALTVLTVEGFARITQELFVGQASFDSVAGPVGIYQLVGDVSDIGFVYLLGFMAAISISLAIINLIPFPALDGGRFLFIVIEGIKGTPIRPRVAHTLNYIGFALLILLMILVTYGDLLRIGVFN